MPGPAGSGTAVGAVLAGGLGRRMGRPKPLETLAGRPLLEYPVAAIEAAGLRPLVVAKPDSALPELPCEVVREPAQPLHPLTGILAALDSAGGEAVVAVACDMPLVPPDLVAFLAGAEEPLVVAEVGGRLEPLLARYTPGTADGLREALERDRPLREAVAALGPRVIGERELALFGDPGRIVFNVNTPADLEAAERLLSGGAEPPEPVAGRAYAIVERDGVRDRVAVEEPLEIRVDGRPLAVTMRTPGHDEELALGFLLGEGLIAESRAVRPAPDLAGNVVDVEGPLLREPGERHFYATSSCGVCGKGALEQVAVQSAPLPAGPRVARATLAGLPGRLRQPAFERTGGLHATGLFDAAGVPLSVREDVGRHNAMDKVVGRALADGMLPLHDRVLCVSGRLSFELVQKAAVAGAPVLVGVGAPSSLAIELAADRGLTLCGFAREGRVNVYTGAGRVA